MRRRKFKEGEPKLALTYLGWTFFGLLQLECLIASAELHLGNLVAVGNNRRVLGLLRKLDPLPLHGGNNFAILQNIQFLLGIVPS